MYPAETLYRQLCHWRFLLASEGVPKDWLSSKDAPAAIVESALSRSAYRVVSMAELFSFELSH